MLETRVLLGQQPALTTEPVYTQRLDHRDPLSPALPPPPPSPGVCGPRSSPLGCSPGAWKRDDRPNSPTEGRGHPPRDPLNEESPLEVDDYFPDQESSDAPSTTPPPPTTTTTTKDKGRRHWDIQSQQRFTVSKVSPESTSGWALPASSGYVSGAGYVFILYSPSWLVYF